MNSIWYDKLHPEQQTTRRRLGLFFGMISLGLLAPFTVKYRESEKVREYLEYLK